MSVTDIRLKLQKRSGKGVARAPTTKGPARRASYRWSGGINFVKQMSCFPSIFFFTSPVEVMMEAAMRVLDIEVFDGLMRSTAI